MTVSLNPWKFGIFALFNVVGMLSVLSVASAQTTFNATESMNSTELQAKIHRLDAMVVAHGGTISPVQLIMRRVIDGKRSGRGTRPQTSTPRGANSSDCTATATVSASGTTPVTLSPTAASCTDAVGMLAKGVRAYLKRAVAFDK